MKYAYEDQGDSQFEELIVCLCQRLLGVSVLRFSIGPDGGRDAKFVGKAELFPSKVEPWVGTTIIQAKHTNGHNRSFSEVDFFSGSTSSTVIGKEITRIKKLVVKKQLDNYILFSNRRLSGNAESQIRAYIAEECGIPESSIYLCGIEQLEAWLKTFPDVPKQVNLDPIDSPLIVSPDDLAEIVEALGRQMDVASSVLDDPPGQRMTYERKNVINNMSDEYANEQLKRYLKETALIHSFLAAPENLELQSMYISVVEEFQLKIIAKRKDYQTFDDVIEYLLDLLFNRDPVLRQHKHKRLTRAMLFYMYWNCDIGAASDAETN